ncbi:peptidylprolyl isomerase [Nitrospirillum sp. BR 11828]|uniref:peptidylprolyl isomerase n=1 Tax=Nitrospirillum sp. BR 11828 TaxID=3104325 RepID=UPI002ACA3975|nr:peptidylprolyl isomerase [Nitrospirillum sp. BR 11828]MDZ5649854.1 peptidylprolyl isomerase [Nitrospirillum sp. BR 11828]
MDTHSHPHEAPAAAPADAKVSLDILMQRMKAAPPPITVNGVVIPRQAIAEEVQHFPADNPAQAWQAAARGLVLRELLMQEARRLAITARPQADADGRVETEEDALLRALVEREVAVPEADEASLRRFYGNNTQRFMTPALYEADHILIAARRDDDAAFAAARDKAAALAALLATEPGRFAALARDFSGCPSATVGGSLGQIGPGDTTPDFEAALAVLDEGAISPPVETRYGVHLIRLNRKIPGRQLPFEAVRDTIARYLTDHVRRQATAQYLALLVGRATIQGIALDGAATPLVQ